MADHERIWLEPECCAYDERHWCQDPDMWEHDPDGEPGHDTPTEYVRADLYAKLEVDKADLALIAKEQENAHIAANLRNAELQAAYDHTVKDNEDLVRGLDWLVSERCGSISKADLSS